MASSSEAVMPVLLRKPRAPKQAPVTIQSCLKKTEFSSVVKPPTSRTSAALSQTCEEFTDMGQYELQAPIYFEKTRPRSPVIVEADKIPDHHTSLQEIPALSSSLGVISRSLVKPTKVRGPDPLPAREPRKKPTIIHVPLDEDITRYYREPEFSLNDFIIQFSSDEHLPVENIEQTMFSRYTYDRLQNVLHERCFPKTASLSVQKLQLPDHLSVGPRKIPYRLLVAEMALAIKEQINQKMGMNNVKSSIRTPLDRESSRMCAEVVLYQDQSDEYKRQLLQMLQQSELPGTDSIVQGPTSRYFSGTKRSSSPTGLPSDNSLSPCELCILDSLLNGGRALSLKAQFMTSLPDVQLLEDSVEYLNLSYNNFEVIPTEVFSMPVLSVLLMRNNPLKQIPVEISKLHCLTTCVFSFGMITSLPVEVSTDLEILPLFTLQYRLFLVTKLEHLDVSYNLLTFVPVEIGKARNLVELNVAGNQLVALPNTIIRLKKLKHLTVSNNFMHPLFWKDAVNDQPQRLTDLSSIAVRQLVAANSQGKSDLPTDVSQVLSNPERCDACGGPRYGTSYCAIRPISKLFGIKNVPLLFRCCSADCKLKFLSRTDGLMELLYGSWLRQPQPSY